MKFVGTTPGDCGNLRAARASELRGVGARLDLDFLHGFRNHGGHAEGHAEVVVVDAIDCEIVIASALPVGGELVGSRCARHCRGQQGQPRDVAGAVINLERQVLNNTLRKRPFDGCRCFFQLHARSVRDRHFGGNGSNNHLLVDDHFLGGRYRDVFDLLGFEARQLNSTE